MTSSSRGHGALIITGRPIGHFSTPGPTWRHRIDLQFASQGLGPENTEDLWCSSECTPPCQGGGRGFKSRQVRSTPERVTRLGRVAQSVERAPEKREVTGSTPVSTTQGSPHAVARLRGATTIFQPGARAPRTGDDEVTSQPMDRQRLLADGVVDESQWLDARHDIRVGESQDQVRTHSVAVARGRRECPVEVLRRPSLRVRLHRLKVTRWCDARGTMPTDIGGT